MTPLKRLSVILATAYFYELSTCDGHQVQIFTNLAYLLEHLQYLTFRSQLVPDTKSFVPFEDNLWFQDSLFYLELYYKNCLVGSF